jgi:hypothetical protein
MGSSRHVFVQTRTFHRQAQHRKHDAEASSPVSKGHVNICLMDCGCGGPWWPHPPRRTGCRRNAAAGSSKNMTPKLLSTTSKTPAPNGCTWASATSNLAFATSAQAASRRASATWIRDKSAPTACPRPAARAARMVAPPQPHPTSRTFSRRGSARRPAGASSVGPASAHAAHAARCRPLAQFQSSASSAFTATKATLHRPGKTPFGTFVPEMATLTGACQSGKSAWRASARSTAAWACNRVVGK